MSTGFTDLFDKNIAVSNIADRKQTLMQHCMSEGII